MHNERPPNDARQIDDGIDVFEDGPSPLVRSDVTKISPVSLRRVGEAVRHICSKRVCKVSSGGRGVRQGEVAVGVHMEAVWAWREQVEDVG